MYIRLNAVNLTGVKNVIETVQTIIVVQSKSNTTPLRDTIETV